MVDWRIYYKNSVVSGSTKKEWLEAQNDGVQVVVVLQSPIPPYPDRVKTGFCFCGKSDRSFYTGVSEYDPLGYNHMKFGSLLSDEEYTKVWERAYGDD